jgi:hypothetical protein
MASWTAAEASWAAWAAESAESADALWTAEAAAMAAELRAQADDVRRHFPHAPEVL